MKSFNLWKLFGISSIVLSIFFLSIVYSIRNNPYQKKYGYLEPLDITEGFYKGFSCLTIEEYRSSVFCEIAKTPTGGTLLPPYRLRIELKHHQVVKFKD